ncbi:hypothetical protein GCM10010399_53870 [Dactylosporangium fulvum]|uniref:LigA protein n=1 Tax=Dactylosporangium fulvum TaxID=53359 RepID=A0ABY5WB12_9ACTN|nr:hypothetical protein [Dactylosporangium fulvum]UWP87247.1 hypothetical protein Dfulv_24595 [Dactylosporangium fulvum]
MDGNDVARPDEAAAAEDAGRRMPLTNFGQYIERLEGHAFHNTYVQRMLDDHSVPPDLVQQMQLTYCEPIETPDILNLLAEHHVTVLVGARGVGRFTSAVCTLATLHHRTEWPARPDRPLRLREIRRGFNEVFDISGIRLAEEVGYVLDARADDEVITPAFGRSLHDLSAQLREARSFLVVVASESLWERVGAGAQAYEIRFTGPPAAQVFEQYLNDRSRATYWLTTPVAQALTRTTAAYAVHVAGLVNEAEAAAPSTEASRSPNATDPRVDAVLAALQNWRKELVEWHRRKPGPLAHGFLLTTAVFPGCPAEVVYTVAASLAGDLDPGAVSTGLAAPGIIELAHEVGATVDAADCIAFGKPGYPSAVVNFFQRNRPDLAPRFRGWLIGLPSAIHGVTEVSDDDRQRMSDLAIDLLTRTVLARRDLVLLRRAVDEWAKNPSLITAAADLVTSCALDTTFGRKVRDETREWVINSGRSGTGSLRALTVAIACGRDLEKAGMSIVVKRLEHLAMHDDDRVCNAVADAVQKLIGSSKAREAFARVLTSRQHDHTANTRGTVQLSLAILGATEPDGMVSVLTETGRDSDMRWLIAAWSSLLTNGDRAAETKRIVLLWLQHANRDNNWALPIAQILIDAAEDADRPGRTSRIIHLCEGLYHQDQPTSIELRIRKSITEALFGVDSAQYRGLAEPGAVSQGQ